MIIKNAYAPFWTGRTSPYAVRVISPDGRVVGNWLRATAREAYYLDHHFERLMRRAIRRGPIPTDRPACMADYESAATRP